MVTAHTVLGMGVQRIKKVFEDDEQMPLWGRAGAKCWL